MGSSRNTHVKVNLQFGAIPFVIHAERFVRELEPLRGTYRGPVSQRYISSQRYIPNNVTLKKRNRLHFMTGASLRLGPGKNCEFPARFKIQVWAWRVDPGNDVEK